MSWPELDAVVGGMPASATNHWSQWWYGDRPNTRSWRAAGYEATAIRPGISVQFVRTGTGQAQDSERPPRTDARRSPSLHSSPPTRVAAVSMDANSTVTALADLDPDETLVIIPCSARKLRGGGVGAVSAAPENIAEARRLILEDPDSKADESLVLPAWRRYDGHLYRAASAHLWPLSQPVGS